MAVVTLENICKRYPGGGELAVDDVSFTVADGEFMVLLGPSGCGKSTTLRMIAGLEGITSGSLSIDNVAMNRVPAKDRDIAMVFQSYALYPHMTVRNNLAFGLKRRGVVDAAPDFVVRQLAQAQSEGHVLEHRHVRVERVVLEHHGDVPVLRRDVIDHALTDHDLAAGDLLEPGDHAQCRALAAARRTDQHDELVVVDFEVDAPHRLGLVVALTQLLQHDLRHLDPPRNGARVF